MFIKIKGHIGNYNCNVVGFYKGNLDYLKERIKYIYGREFGVETPSYFNEIKTIKGLKQFVKDEMIKDMRNYPYGFKHIDGIYCLYEAYG